MRVSHAKPEKKRSETAGANGARKLDTTDKSDRPSAPGFRSSLIAVMAALLLLIASGIGHRLLAERIVWATNRSVAPVKPLSTLPMKIGPWEGRDVPLDEHIQRVAGEDQFINRRYVNVQTRRSIGFYVGYVGRARSRLGHRPDVCYPAHGWKQASQEGVEITTTGGKEIPSVLYEFRSPDIAGPRDLVLAVFLINGQYGNGRSFYNEYNGRDPNLFQRQEPYVLRIQASIQSSGDHSMDFAVLSDFVSHVVEPIEAMMPHAGAVKQDAQRPPGFLPGILGDVEVVPRPEASDLGGTPSRVRK